jgi:Domain of unknown function (DUF6745)
VLNARMELGDGDVSRLFAQATLDDPLSQAEQRLWVGARAALSSGIFCPTTGTLVTQSYFSEYTFSMMADDEDAVGTGTPPAILRAAWTVARTSGLWWPFERGAVLTDRPTEVHVDDQGLLHRLDGPALVSRDGSQVYAWTISASVSASADSPATRGRTTCRQKSMRCARGCWSSEP